MWKLAPREELGASHRHPLCDSMMERVILSPIPVPRSLVVKNASKILSTSLGRPTPVSVTDNKTSWLSPGRDLIESMRVPTTPFIASMLLTIRFTMTYSHRSRT
jgi:hypothetical protein